MINILCNIKLCSFFNIFGKNTTDEVIAFLCTYIRYFCGVRFKKDYVPKWLNIKIVKSVSRKIYFIN